jgi:hypothetical protein
MICLNILITSKERLAIDAVSEQFITNEYFPTIFCLSFLLLRKKVSELMI